MELKINSEKINRISYANDKVAIVKIEAQMQKMIDQISSTGQKYGMKINAGKTKVMQFTKDDDKEVQIKIRRQEIENINESRYVGVLINNDGRDLKEIKTRIDMVKNVLNNLS